MKKIIAVMALLLAAGSAMAFELVKDSKVEYPKFKISGWMKVVYQDTVYKDTTVTYPSGFEVKDAAFVISGDVWSDVAYRICLQSNKSSKVGTNYVYAAWLFDAYIDWKPSKRYSFRVGQYKRPFGYEQLLAATSMDFINAAQLTGKFNSSNRDQGLMVFGAWNDLNYSLSLSNGAPYNEKDANWTKTVVSRVCYVPMAGMTVGGSAEYGTQNLVGRSLYNRHAGLDASWDWNKLFVRGECMIGLDDRTLAADSVMVNSSWVKRSGTDRNLMRGAYLTAGYVPMSRLKVSARADMFRQNYQWDLITDGTNTWWDKTESRVMIYDLGADYFLNPNTKVTLNYSIRQEDMALIPVKNNVLMAQLQVKF